jgi:broad specificity phosphatase PhoE
MVVVRHGRTAWNADGRFQGHSDIPLDEEGRRQARALAALLAAERFDAAVASDLSRAWETAATIVAGRDLALDPDARWREMRFGAWEGLTWPEIVERNPALADASAVAPKFYTPAGGETFDEVCTRIAAAVAALDARAHDGARVLVATHAGPLHALLRVVLGESEATALGVRFSPASITRFALGPAGGRVVELNATAPQAAS